MMKSLKQRAVNSGKWVAFGHLSSQLLRLFSNLALTRLLVPEMFGVMAVVTVIMGGLAMFSDVGLLQNIVQSKRGEEREYLNTAWTIQVIRGFVIFLLALILSGILYFLGKGGFLNSDTVYGDSQLPLILPVVAVSVVISSFNSIHMLVLNRKLMISKLIKIELLSQVIGLIFMLIWAWYQRDIWALVFGGLISASVKMFLSHTSFIEGECHFSWDSEAVHDIIHFGKWIFLSSIFGFLLNQGDRLILGGVLSAEMLGIYSISFFLATALKDFMSKLISSVFFPVLSQVVLNEPDKIQMVYYKIRAKIDAITMFSAGVLYSSGSMIVSILYDERYSQAGRLLEILSISLIFVGLMLAGQLFMSYGKTKYISVLALFQMVGLYLFVPYCFVKYGLEAAVWAIALNPLINVAISTFLMKKYFFLKPHRELMFLPLFAIGLLVGEQLNKIFS
jgi:O-antigen/teichoic acid export membrane protein